MTHEVFTTLATVTGVMLMIALLSIISDIWEDDK